MAVLFSSCVNDEHKEESILFIGDSHIRNWDHNYWFPYVGTDNQGISGISTSDLIQNKDLLELPQRKLLLIGVNDIFKLYANGMEEKQIVDSVLFNYTLILENFNSNDIIISIFPVSEELDNKCNLILNTTISDLNIKIREACTKKNISYIDGHSILLKDNNLNAIFTLDGIHLNNIGYETISKEVRKFIY